MKRADSLAEWDFFSTKLGWFAIRHAESVIHQLKFGFKNRELAVRAIGYKPNLSSVSQAAATWRSAISAYAKGDPSSLAGLNVCLDGCTDFQRRVIETCREIPLGQTVTYGELAASCGSQGASRAVGTVMRNNPVPIIVPCHRVVGAHDLGGYSAHRGIETKRLLLEFEGALNSDRQTVLF